LLLQWCSRDELVGGDGFPGSTVARTLRLLLLALLMKIKEMPGP
jgi:hypothetical protein